MKKNDLNYYYLNVLNNLNKSSEKLFYKYYKIEYNYSDFKKYACKVITLIDQFYLLNKRKPIIFTYSNKSFEMYASIFPILISRAVWVPLSINYPIEKINNILNQIKPDIFLYDIKINKKLFNLIKSKTKLIKFNSLYKLKEKKINFKKVINKIKYDETSFVYFTSGSTGDSKGIKISHKNIISDVYAQKKHLYDNKCKNLIFGDYYDTAFSIFFDIYFPAIFFGACISPGKNENDIFFPIKHINQNRVNNLVCVPSTIQRIKDFSRSNKINFKTKFKQIIITGEPFYLNLLNYVFSLFKCERIFNCYGGTEMGNWVFYHRCEKEDENNYKKYNLVPIGKNFSSVKFKIIKKELIVWGPMITNGYLKKELNKNFIFSKTNTFYTSDLVEKYKGVLICKGRKDNMIKLRGFRIELPEIEANIRKIPYVKQCVVLHIQKKSEYSNYIAAMVSVDNNVDEVTFRNDLSNYLPKYMIPRQLTLVKKLPLNLNGKIDRKKIHNIIRIKNKN